MSDQAGSPHSILASASRYPNLVALLCTAEAIYLAGRFSLWKLDLDDGLLQPWASLSGPWLVRQAARSRHLRRLGRLDVRELVQLPSGRLLGAAHKRIIGLDRGETEFRTAFQVNNGGRPKGFAVTPGGHIFVGEYWSNPRRQALRLWASTDSGDSWEVAHVFPPGRAKHIHNVVWDQHRQGLWLLTGDADGECALLFTGDACRTITEVVRGAQTFRACKVFCLPDGLYYGTDTERAPNWFVYLDIDRGQVHKIRPLPGSCFDAAEMDGRYFISTAVEPSNVNHYRKTVLWSSSDLHNWSEIVEFEKDWWPGEYFGFGNIILPRIQGDCRFLVFSTMAIKNYDLTTFLFHPPFLL
jgi:hypothetical protein